MKILILSHMYPSRATPLGGIFVQKQAEAFMDAGSKVILVNPIPWAPFFLKWNSRWRLYAQMPRMETYRGMTVYHPRYLVFPKGRLFASGAGRYYAGVASLMRKLTREWKPDLIQAHVAHPDGAAAVRFGDEYGIPVVVTVHGLDFTETMGRSAGCARSVKRTLNKATGVILVSEVLRDKYGLAQWVDNPDKCRVIYNGVHVSDLITEPEGTVTEGMEKHTIPDKKGAGRDRVSADPDKVSAPVLLTVGFLREPKGHAFVLKALPEMLNKFPGLTYRIVGDGEERRALESLAEELGVGSRVVFRGALSNQDAMEEMAACDIMVLPSWDEGFGVVYLEAMAHGKPVIATQGEGAAPLIEREGVGMTVPARDAEGIARAVSEILGNRDLAHSMGQRGREVVLAQLTWERNVEHTLGFYREVLNP